MDTNTTNPTKLFFRYGGEFTGTAKFDAKNKPFTTIQEKCSRCGGAGGAEQWRFTGWTCYQCGGTGKGVIRDHKLYTQEQLDKLIATAAKKQAKKDAIRAEAAAKLETERAARRTAMMQEHAAVLAIVREMDDQFINEIIDQCIERASISPKQIELVHKRKAELDRKAGSTYVGTIGERREFTVTLQMIRSFRSRFGYREVTNYLHIMRDADGHTIKYMGSNVLANVQYVYPEGQRYRGDEPTLVFDKNEVFKFVATVKEHTEYQGEKQTVVARPVEGPARDKKLEKLLSTVAWG